jgi:hypothetical protein
LAWFVGILLLVALSTSGGGAVAADVRVLSGGAVKAAVTDLAEA